MESCRFSLIPPTALNPLLLLLRAVGIGYAANHGPQQPATTDQTTTKPPHIDPHPTNRTTPTPDHHGRTTKRNNRTSWNWWSCLVCCQSLPILLTKTIVAVVFLSTSATSAPPPSFITVVKSYTVNHQYSQSYSRNISTASFV